MAKMISISLSNLDWMNLSSLLECVSLAVLKSDDLKPEMMERYSRLYYVANTIRLEVLKTCDSYPLLYNELKDISLNDVLNKF